MKRLIKAATLCLCCAALSVGAFAQDAPQKAITIAKSVEALSNPAGVDSTTPRFSWITEAAGTRNKKQSAYQLLVASSLEKLANNEGDLWDTGKVQSEESNFVSYAGAPLESLTRYYWKARVWDEQDQPTDWSAPSTWVQGIVKSEDWQGEWIAQGKEARPDVDMTGAGWIGASDSRESNAGYEDEAYRRVFVLDRPQSDFDNQNLSGLLYFAACERFEIFVNGKKVGHSIGMVYNPDQLRSIDVSEYLQPGKNVVSFLVHNLTKQPNNTKFGDGTLYPTALVAKLVVRELNKENAPSNLPTPNRFGRLGEVALAVGTDASWKATSGARADNWTTVDFDDSQWPNATRASFVAEGAEWELDETPWGKLRRRNEITSPVVQKSFNVSKEVSSAYLAVCAPGLFEAYLDGQKVGDQVLTPSFTRYDRRLLYNVLDVTDYFKSAKSSSKHELEFILGHSWYDVRSIVTWNFDAAPWRDFPRVKAQLKLVYTDGSVETVATDGTWTYSTSPIVFDCVRQGEIVDGAWNREILGQAEVVDAPRGEPKVTAQKNALSVVTDVYEAKSVKEVKPGLYIVDMGRNCAGWARVRITGQKKGDVIRFRYSERVVDSGEIERHDIAMHFMEGTPAYLTGMKGEFQTDFYFCNGEEEEFFEPRFTYNGYQYIEVLGLRSAPKASDFVGRRINTAFDETGSFECDNELLNELQKATLESYRNNFVAGFPTDCPHREKNGWTGDANLACELAQYNFANTSGYEKWIDDLVDEQRPDGNLPGIVPSGDWGYPWGNGPAWDSSLVMIPWCVYVYQGDKKILEDSYDAMKKYVDYMTSRRHDDGLLYHGLGDWVPVKTVTPVEAVVTGFYYVDANVVSQTAKLLGKTEDAEKYAALASKIRDDYNAVLYKGDGVYTNGGQTAQSCPIHQGFTRALSQEDQQAVVARLVESVEKENNHFDVGILGMKYVLRSLAENGRNDLALAMMLQEDRPAVSDWIKRGAGTLWEDWGEGSSRNHIMFGDFSAWYYQSLAGLKLAGAPDVVVAETDPSAVAFKHFVVEPKTRKNERTAPGRESLKRVAASIVTPYGKASSSWRVDENADSIRYEIEVPFNTTATVILPCEAGYECQALDGSESAKRASSEDGDVAVFEVGSGIWSFAVTKK